MSNPRKAAERLAEMTRKRDLSKIKTLAMLKMEKNFRAIFKGYLRQPYNDPKQDIWFLMNRILEEYYELHEAYMADNWDNFREELADMSNIIDYIYEKVQEEK